MNNLIIQQNKIEFSKDQIDLVKRQIAPNATDTELKLFLYQAQRTGLDPLNRQIYCIHRGGKMTVQTSIDGFRVIAERSGDYGGQDEPLFNEVDGKVISCKVTVYRFKGDIRYPASVGVAYMAEYNAGGPMWVKMPHTMLSKCAEAVALRKAYPQDLSGLYTNDEMNQADIQKEPDFDNIPSESERKLLRNMVFNSTLNEEQRIATLEKIENCITYDQYAIYQHRLEDVQTDYNDVPNPNAKDAKLMVKKILGPKPVES